MNESDSFEEFSNIEEVCILENDFPLHAAVLSDDREKIKQNIGNGSTINMHNACHETPLHLTRYLDDEHKRCAVMQLLLESKADPNSTYLSAPGHTDFYVMLNTLGGLLAHNMVLLNHYVKHDCKEEVKLLLRYKANADEYFSLHEAVQYQFYPLQLKSPKLIECLLYYKADVNKKNKYGDTPLHTCIKNSSFFFALDYGLAKCKSLLEYDADVGLQDSDGNTIFHQENFWHYCGKDCFVESQKVIKTMLTLRKIQSSVLNKLPKPLLYTIIKIAHPWCKILLNPELPSILCKKNKENKTAYDLLCKQHRLTEQVNIYKEKKENLEMLMSYFKPRDK